jgi:hypothetical protein
MVAPRRRHVGWIVAGAMVVAVAALVWGSSRAPVTQAAGNPLYLHGTGVSPACAPLTMDQTIGVRATPCAIQSGSVAAVFGFTNLPAQTLAAGIWSFTMNWSGGTGNVADTLTLSAGVTALPTCAGFTATIPNGGTTWTATFGSGSANPNSPLTLSTSGGQAALTIAAGGSLCLRVLMTHSTGGKPSMLYDGAAGDADTRLVPPTTVVPESVLAFVGLALMVPVFTARRRIVSLVKVRARR